MVRIKQRYLLFNILYPGSAAEAKKSLPTSLSFQAPTPDYLDAGRLVGHIRNHITLLFGDFGLGLSLSSLKIVYFSSATSTVILRVPRNHHRIVWAALTHVTELPSPRRGEPGKPCVIRVVRVSGTIRKAEEELIRRTRRDIVMAKLTDDGKGETWLAGLASRGADGEQLAANVNVNMKSIEDLSGDESDESD
ncbi:RNA-binding protein pop5 [Neophaeococcomyces mojaviensis]|uniref:RNA-binding protein pop5 n=1 Tax=Neophaeococcomyces mojaviensis TaxID=3383035 RepID=A0ACC2ZZ02_9EURO|nr:RNA-binding protein pop5 [Knufia sp. JES_112]